ncbi:hypothetical protein [Apibacter adventoris]|uniref:hypothetical protein n=1 Tax=Apibacter adventoris TaxID=1679466 RepID=UPI0011B0CCBD|nr:hypothetical protein [Apibacter adventoris]
MEKEEFYIYGTSRFKEKEKELKISIEEAKKLYLSVNQNETENYSLAIIYGDSYIFNSILLYDLKTGIYTLSGIWINGNSGEINKIKTDKYIRISLSNDLSIYYHDVPQTK